MPPLCETASFCPLTDYYNLDIQVNDMLLQYAGRVECLAERDIDSYETVVLNNYLNALMTIRLVLYGPHHRICSDSNSDLNVHANRVFLL